MQSHIKNMDGWSHTRKMTLATVLAALTAILQASGNYVPIIGLFVSMFATSSIFISVIVSIRYGILTYIVSIVLLLILTPTEFFVFPFTTGLLGLSLGIGVRLLMHKPWNALCSGTMLTCGIFIVFYLFGFPVLGPIQPTFRLSYLTFFITVTTSYSYLWLCACLYIFKRIEKMM